MDAQREITSALKMLAIVAIVIAIIVLSKWELRLLVQPRFWLMNRHLLSIGSFFVSCNLPAPAVSGIRTIYPGL
jgi:hypothetical protein